jgi:hypothetical protein
MIAGFVRLKLNNEFRPIREDEIAQRAAESTLHARQRRPSFPAPRFPLSHGAGSLLCSVGEWARSILRSHSGYCFDNT